MQSLHTHISPFPTPRSCRAEQHVMTGRNQPHHYIPIPKGKIPEG